MLLKAGADLRPSGAIVSKSCILSVDLQGAAPLFAERSRIVGSVHEMTLLLSKRKLEFMFLMSSFKSSFSK